MRCSLINATDVCVCTYASEKGQANWSPSFIRKSPDSTHLLIGKFFNQYPGKVATRSPNLTNFVLVFKEDSFGQNEGLGLHWSPAIFAGGDACVCICTTRILMQQRNTDTFTGTGKLCRHVHAAGAYFGSPPGETDSGERTRRLDKDSFPVSPAGLRRLDRGLLRLRQPATLDPQSQSGTLFTRSPHVQMLSV